MSRVARAWALASVVLTPTLFLAGCGAAAPGAAKAPPPAEPASAPPSAGYALDEAPADEEAEAPAQPGVSSARGPGEPRWAEPPTRREATTVEQALADLEEDEELFLTALDESKRAVELSGGDGPSRCRRACSALGSMRRSVAAVCRLAGEDDARCERAQGVLDRSEERMTDAGCGCD